MNELLAQIERLNLEMSHKLKQGLYVKNCDELEAFEDKLLESGLSINADDYNKDHLLHKTVNGMHARILFIQKGDFLTGRIHKEPYVDILASGKVYVRSFLEDGSEEPAEIVDGPRMLTGLPGRKRVLEAIEDCVWITVDRTTKTEYDDIKSEVTFMKMDEYRKASDYRMLLDEHGLTEEFMWEKSNSESVIESESKFELRKSSIHGLGMFAILDVKQGELIGQARIDGVKTFLGRFVNHSKDNNAIARSGDWDVIAIKDIKVGEELLYNYRDTMGYLRASV